MVCSLNSLQIMILSSLQILFCWLQIMIWTLQNQFCSLQILFCTLQLSIWTLQIWICYLQIVKPTFQIVICIFQIWILQIYFSNSKSQIYTRLIVNRPFQKTQKSPNRSGSLKTTSSGIEKVKFSTPTPVCHHFHDACYRPKYRFLG